MSIIRKIKSGISDFSKGLAIIFSPPQKGEGDRGLAKMGTIVMALIPIFGANRVRKQAIKSIESELKRSAKNGMDAVDAMVKNAQGTPEYMQMLRKLNLDASHLYAVAAQVKRSGGGDEK